MNTTKALQVVVVGGIGTDVTGLELDRLVGPGELEFGGNLKIGAGGKSRNIAQMLATLLGPGSVAMVGKTSRDPFGLWNVPISALQNAGVNVNYVKILEFAETGKFPQVALIAVDKNGRNQIYVIPGINNDFSPTDIAEAREIFESVKAAGGIAVLSLELPLATAVATVALADQLELRVLLDPGGIRSGLDYSALFACPIYLIKPNEHEAHMLTGIEVKDLNSARKAAHVFMERGVQNVLITLGADGALFFDRTGDRPIPLPLVESNGTHDETGCGDQTMATLCARLLCGDDLSLAVERAILAGTMQFNRLGIVPVSAAELEQQFELIWTSQT
jgi:ribokinase